MKEQIPPLLSDLRTKVYEKITDEIHDYLWFEKAELFDRLFKKFTGWVDRGMKAQRNADIKHYGDKKPKGDHSEVLSDEVFDDILGQSKFGSWTINASDKGKIIDRCEHLIQQAGKEGYDAGEAFVYSHWGDEVEQAKKETVSEIEPLIDRLFEALAHADFSNGIVADGIDEGDVRGYEMKKGIEKDWHDLKSKYQKEDKK